MHTTFGKRHFFKRQSALAGPTDVDENHLLEVAEEDQYWSTRELTKELDDSTISISRAMHSKKLA